MDVVYNASNNELVRTKTLVKNAIVQIDATPFKQWYNFIFFICVNSKWAITSGVEISLFRLIPLTGFMLNSFYIIPFRRAREMEIVFIK